MSDERIEADWQVLAARLAREVMGWLSWDDLTDEQRVATLTQSGMSAGICETLWWSWSAERGRAIAPLSEEWRPHLDDVQAMMVLDAIFDLSFDTDIKRRHCQEQHEIWIAPMACRGRWVGCHTERPKAICLAAKAWLDREEK